MNPASIPLQLISLDEAARRIGFSRKTLQREINAGRFPQSVKVGTRSCCRVGDVDAYIQREQEATARMLAEAEAERKKWEKFQEYLRSSRCPEFLRPHNGPIVTPRAFRPDDPNRLP